MIPVELIEPHVRKFVKEAGSYDGVMEGMGLSGELVYQILGKKKDLTFHMADKILCKIHRQYMWYVPPLNEYYWSYELEIECNNPNCTNRVDIGILEIRKYCSENCRKEYKSLREQKKAIERKREMQKKCKACDEDFLPRSNAQLYCSKECRPSRKQYRDREMMRLYKRKWRAKQREKEKGAEA